MRLHQHHITTIMSTYVFLILGEGSFQHGFPVTLQIGDDGKLPSVQISGRLPAAPKLPEHYENWRSAMRELAFRPGIIQRKLEPITGVMTNVSISELSSTLSHSLNEWLNSKEFRPLKDELLASLTPKEEIRILIQTPNLLQLWRLPWHLWDLCDRFPKAEIALSPANYQQIISSNPARTQVDILAILGDSTGLDLQKDREMLEQLPGAKAHFLVEPSRPQLHDMLWSQPWDILYFAGHSYTENSRGLFDLNKTDRVTISEVKHALKRTICQGLQLAIFNSCDGLGLALELGNLNIPQAIVMGEPVPNKVAQAFLKYFLSAYSGGKSLYLSVREARERLYSLEPKYSCASWLPVICQNPATIPPTWPPLPR